MTPATNSNHNQYARPIALAVVGVLCLAYLVSAWWPKPSVNDVASQYLRALVAGRPHEMYSYLPSQETQQAGLSREQFTLFYNRFIRPQLAGAKLTQLTMGDSRHDPGIQSAQAIIRSETLDIPVFVEAYKTTEGPKVFGMYDLIYLAVVLSAIADGKQLDSSERFERAASWLGENRLEINQMGIRRIYFSGDGIVTLEALQERFEAITLAAQARRARQVAPN